MSDLLRSAVENRDRSLTAFSRIHIKQLEELAAAIEGAVDEGARSVTVILEDRHIREILEQVILRDHSVHDAPVEQILHFTYGDRFPDE